MLKIHKPTYYLFLLLIIWLASCTNPQEKSASLLIEQRSDTYKIFNVNVDGSNLQELIEFPRGHNQYWISPNGQKIAVLTIFEHEVSDSRFPSQSLTIIDLQSNEILGQVSDAGYIFKDSPRYYRLTDDSVVWSTQGNKLVFERNAGDDNRSLWVYNLDTDSVTLLSQSHTDNSHPTWSPDGTKIAFTSWQSCGKDLDYCLPEEQFWDIMIVDADGGNLHAITDFRNTDFFSEDNDFSAKTLCNLNWSPDGQAIAFENSCLRGSFNPSHVFTVDIKTKLLFQATDFASTQIESDLSSDSESTTIFSYSTHWAESANMLYIGYSHSKYLSTNLDLFGGVLIVDKENHLTHQTTEILGLRSPMYWSPDTSKFIGFTIRLDNQRTISGPTYLGQLPTPNGTFSLTNISPKLPFGSCDDLRAFWAPDSQYVAYAITPEDRSCVDEELNRGVAIVSISDGRYINVAESIPGDNRPIGWMIIDE